jgi:hypothetical protein
MLAWQKLALLPEPDLAKRDVVEVNLACVADFPEVQHYKSQAVFDRLEFLTREVKRYTNKTLPQFRRKRYDYYNSETYFRCLAMVTCVERTHRVGYDPDKRDEHTTHTAVDSSLYGPILGQGGTCASLPVVFAAIGRRLGYPIKLANCKSHVYWRWDEPGECFNVDSSGNGLASYPDDYYRTGKYEVTKEQEEAFGFVRSLTPREELGLFIKNRAFRWLELGERQLACHAFLWALACQPQSKGAFIQAASHLHRWHEDLKARIPPRFPALNRDTLPPRMFPIWLPHPLEHDFHCLVVLETLLNDPRAESRWWAALRRGEQPRDRVPVAVVVAPTPTGFSVAFTYGEDTMRESWGTPTEVLRA